MKNRGDVSSTQSSQSSSSSDSSSSGQSILFLLPQEENYISYLTSNISNLQLEELQFNENKIG